VRCGRTRSCAHTPHRGDHTTAGPVHRASLLTSATFRGIARGKAVVVLTYYDVLGVEPTAELETIRRAWRLKVRLLHPDRHQDSPTDVRAEATRETRRVNKAWATLRDSNKRHEYDDRLPRRNEINLERETTEATFGPDAGEAWHESLSASPYFYLNLTSLLIVVVAIGFLLVGAVLLARLL
jgi:hypothetical protein